MSPDAQRIVIAEACGWYVEHWQSGGSMCFTPQLAREEFLTQEEIALIIDCKTDLRELLKDKARLDWLDAECEVNVSTACAGSDIFGHNKFLNPERPSLREEIDAAIARHEGKGL